MNKRILVVDDEATQVRILESVLEREGYAVETAANGKQALTRILNPKGEPLDLVVLDLSMPEMTGIDVLKALEQEGRSLPVVVLTAHSSIQNVVEAMRHGAMDFLVKPASAERIRTAIRAALANDGMVGEISALPRPLGKDLKLSFRQLVGASPAMIEAVAIAKRAAGTTVPVLIEGESGVGKELFARSIQAASDRHDKPFVVVNCGAIPENLVESILFGHEKGAFTGANERHAGKFEEANGGTLFLDEVGELRLDMQVKLLRALQEGEIDPVGARAPVKVDIRIVSATNRDMARMVAAGEFREDLYYRLSVFPLKIPPLRERREDIPELARYFVAKIAETEGLKPKELGADALALLTRYNWPGNIRQLQNALFRAMILADGTSISDADFPQIQVGPSPYETAHTTSAPVASMAAPPVAHHGPVSIFDAGGQIRPMKDIEADVIAFAIDHYRGRMSEVARRLGIGRSTLYRKLAEIGIENPDMTE